MLYAEREGEGVKGERGERRRGGGASLEVMVYAEREECGGRER